MDSISQDSKITADGDSSHEIKRHFLLGRKAMTNLDNILKAEILLCQKSLSSKSYGFYSGHVWMWELDYKECWAPKNWCLWTVVFEKTLETPLDCNAINLINPKGHQSWIFIGMTDAEAETTILWPPDAKNRFSEGRMRRDDREWDGWMASLTSVMPYHYWTTDMMVCAGDKHWNLNNTV